MSEEWWDRTDTVRLIPAGLELVGFRYGTWFLRRSPYQLLQHVIEGELAVVGHRHDMLRTTELRALRDRLHRETTTGVVRA